MGIGRSTFYDMPDARARDLTIVAEMKTICDEFEAYGYRSVGCHCQTHLAADAGAEPKARL